MCITHAVAVGVWHRWHMALNPHTRITCRPVALLRPFNECLVTVICVENYLQHNQLSSIAIAENKRRKLLKLSTRQLKRIAVLRDSKRTG